MIVQDCHGGGNLDTAHGVCFIMWGLESGGRIIFTMVKKDGQLWIRHGVRLGALLGIGSKF